MPALGYEGYWCAMGQIRNGDTRQGDSLIIFKPAIHNFPSVWNTKPSRIEVVIRSEKEYCKLFLEITIEELFNACNKANEKAAANRKAGD
jgi:predicted oxidoreductase (fatty acid repression mutant protein)